MCKYMYKWDPWASHFYCSNNKCLLAQQTTLHCMHAVDSHTSSECFVYTIILWNIHIFLRSLFLVLPLPPRKCFLISGFYSCSSLVSLHFIFIPLHNLLRFTLARSPINTLCMTNRKFLRHINTSFWIVQFFCLFARDYLQHEPC